MTPDQRSMLIEKLKHLWVEGIVFPPHIVVHFYEHMSDDQVIKSANHLAPDLVKEICPQHSNDT